MKTARARKLATPAEEKKRKAKSATADFSMKYKPRDKSAHPMRPSSNRKKQISGMILLTPPTTPKKKSVRSQLKNTDLKDSSPSLSKRSMKPADDSHLKEVTVSSKSVVMSDNNKSLDNSMSAQTKRTRTTSTQKSSMKSLSPSLQDDSLKRPSAPNPLRFFTNSTMSERSHRAAPDEDHSAAQAKRYVGRMVNPTHARDYISDEANLNVAYDGALSSRSPKSGSSFGQNL